MSDNLLGALGRRSRPTRYICACCMENRSRAADTFGSICTYRSRIENITDDLWITDQERQSTTDGLWSKDKDKEPPPPPVPARACIFLSHTAVLLTEHMVRSHHNLVWSLLRGGTTYSTHDTTIEIKTSCPRINKPTPLGATQPHPTPGPPACPPVRPRNCCVCRQ